MELNLGFIELMSKEIGIGVEKKPCSQVCLGKLTLWINPNYYHNNLSTFG